ncbi:hypothetical protein PR048_033059 [Dryococelus australis]|uniref:Uncharacterized protein n=1 Tax=Dryococelus australis TaxID=614101 RepID=A0ABQ9FZ67_9NEOP|nr:hypothetical protein PR048_033059 [Dryococelus australis]
MRGWRRRESPEKTRRAAVSSSTIRTCEIAGVNRPGIEPGSPRGERSTARTTSGELEAQQPHELRQRSPVSGRMNDLERQSANVLLITSLGRDSCEEPSGPDHQPGVCDHGDYKRVQCAIIRREQTETDRLHCKKLRIYAGFEGLGKKMVVGGNGSIGSGWLIILTLWAGVRALNCQPQNEKRGYSTPTEGQL